MAPSIPTSTLEKFTNFGDLLRFLRRRMGITQMELAIAVGYSDAQISRLEQNLRLPDIPTIEARFVPALDLENEPRVVTRLVELAANVRREDAPALGLCPYKGLSYFDEVDADLFVGREALTARLVECTLALTVSNPPSDVRFLAVIGASGSGKSSLARAGLVPALHWNKASADWIVHVLTPTAHPLESLALSLCEENSSIAETAQLLDDFAQERRSLHLYARREVQSTPGKHLVLVIDQFEELFTLCRSEQERSQFIDNLLTAVTEPDGPVLVIITLRADFYAHCAVYAELREALARHQVYIGAMQTGELRRAIEEPARRGRWELEPGLVELLLHDVGHEPGALPLLSHALLETWQRRRGRMLTLSGYTSSGGVRGAIAETAEAVFADQFTAEEKVIARRIFLRLTELGDENAAGDTRRRASFNELILRPEEATQTQAVLKALADARLIITGTDSAEVAHEALIREWPTLRGWLEDNREGLRLHRKLTDAAQEWAARNREGDVLYRGAMLAQVLEWTAGHEEEINALEREFLDASQALADCETTERENQRQRELAAAQKLAEAESRRAEEQTLAARQLKLRNLFLGAAFVIAIALALTAGFLGWQARTASRVAISRELAAAALSNLDIDPERSVLLAMEAISSTYTLEAENALHQAVMASRARLTITASKPGLPVNVTFSPDGTQLTTASPDEVVKVWDAASGGLIFSINGHSADFSPDGKRLATVISDGSIKLWDADTGTEIHTNGQMSAGVWVDFSPDGSRLVTVTSGNLPRIWDLETGQELVSFPGHNDYVSNAVFSPDDKHLLTASDDGTARVWDTVSGEELLNLSDHPGWVWSAVYSPDGKRIATLSNNETRIWDAASGELLLTLTGHKDSIYAVAFSPDSTRLATGSLDRKVKVWDSATGAELLTLAGHTGAIDGVAFSPDGTRLASSSDDGTVRIWELSSSREWLAFDNPAGVGSQIVYNSAGDRLAGAEKNLVKVWDAATGEERLSLSGYSNLVNALAFSPDGKRLAAAGDTAQVRVWELPSGKELNTWTAHTGRLNTLAISPDGTLLVTGSDDYKVKIWDLASGAGSPGAVPLVFDFELASEIKSLAFSLDGSRLAAGISNGNIKVWGLAERKEILSWPGHSNAVMAVAFSPDGRLLATASLDGTAKIWGSDKGSPLLTLDSHTGPVMAAAFSPDGKRLATASGDGTVKMWDPDADQELLTFYGDGKSLKTLAFSPDGTRLATSSDTEVRVYLLNIGDLMALAHSRVTRMLTVEECQNFLHKASENCVQPASIPTPTSLPPAPNGRICQITNTGGLNDNYFNALIHSGIVNSARQYGWETGIIQTISISDIEENLQAYVDADCNLIVTSGTFLDATQKASGLNPEERYMLMDFIPDPLPNNLWVQIYATDQAAFLAGYVAGTVTKTGKVGVFGGIDIPQVTDFMDGFSLGVAYYNEMNGAGVEVIGWDAQKHTGLFSGGFCCATEGRQMARQLLEQGVDVVLPVAGQNIGTGAGEAIMAHGNAWFIGVDTDWTITAPVLAEVVLTSIEKRFDISVLQASKSIVEGTFSGGIHTGTLATGEVGIAPFHNLDWIISAKVKNDLEKIQAGIISGEIKTKP